MELTGQFVVDREQYNFSWCNSYLVSRLNSYIATKGTWKGE